MGRARGIQEGGHEERRNESGQSTKQERVNGQAQSRPGQKRSSVREKPPHPRYVTVMIKTSPTVEDPEKVIRLASKEEERTNGRSTICGRERPRLKREKKIEEEARNGV